MVSVSILRLVDCGEEGTPLIVWPIAKEIEAMMSWQLAAEEWVETASKWWRGSLESSHSAVDICGVFDFKKPNKNS